MGAPLVVAYGVGVGSTAQQPDTKPGSYYVTVHDGRGC